MVDRRPKRGQARPAREEVRIGLADLPGLVAGVAGVAGDSHRRLERRALAREIAPWPSRPVPGVGEHDQRGLDLAKLVVIQAPLAHDARRVVLQDNIALAYEVEENFLALGLAHVKHQRAFAAIHHVEDAGAVPRVPGRIVVQVGAERAPARLVEFVRGLDLDDISAKIAEQSRHVGDGKHVRKIEHAHAGQWQGWLIFHASRSRRPGGVQRRARHVPRRPGR